MRIPPSVINRLSYNIRRIHRPSFGMGGFGVANPVLLNDHFPVYNIIILRPEKNPVKVDISEKQG